MLPNIKGSKSCICDNVFDMYSEEPSVKDSERKKHTDVVPIEYFIVICLILVQSVRYFQNSRSNFNLSQMAHINIILIYYNYTGCIFKLETQVFL